MKDIKHLLLQKAQSHDKIMIWAACFLAFFGFLRISEFTVPAQGQYDHITHFSLVMSPCSCGFLFPNFIEN